MPVLHRSLLWRRLDTAGTEHALLDQRAGMHARGTIIASDPVPYTLGYELLADQSWASARLTVTAEGAGWLRSVKLERAMGRWHITAGEQGNLDAVLRAAGHARADLPGCEEPDGLQAALDLDLGYSPLTNTLPLRRLGLRRAAAGTSHTVPVAWVLVPSLTVIRANQTYTVLGEGRVRYESGTFAADLAIDHDGYVTHYPGLAERVEPSPARCISPTAAG
jgi:uncharacterized protein